MKRSFYIVIFLLFFITTGAYAENKTRFGAQIGLFYPGIFIDVPVSDLSSLRLGVGTMWGFAEVVDAKYRRRFGGTDASYY